MVELRKMNDMPEKESFFKILKKEEKTPEKLEPLEIIKRGIESTLTRLEADPKEREGELLKDKNFKRSFPHWKEDFWKAEKEYAEIPQPKNATEQTFVWNSGQAPLKGKIIDGFKQLGPIIMGREKLKELKELRPEDAILLMEEEASAIIAVDRKRDRELDKLCKWARMLNDGKQDEEERIFLVAKKVHEIMGGNFASEEDIRKIEKTGKRGKEISLGDVNLGACHERALLFQVLAKEAEMESNMQKTKYLGSHSYNPVFLKNGEILMIDAMYPPSSRNKYFNELSYQEFKAMGAFPRFGSNLLPFEIYQDAAGRFQGGKLGADGLRELLKK